VGAFLKMRAFFRVHVAVDSADPKERALIWTAIIIACLTLLTPLVALAVWVVERYK